MSRPHLPALLTFLALPGCRGCFEPPPGPGFGITNERGVVQSRVPGPGPGSQALLVQKLDGRRRLVPYVHVYYTADREVIARIRKALGAARPWQPSTCPPAWRLDFLGPGGDKSYFVNLACGLLRHGWRFWRLGRHEEEALSELFGRATRRPSHKVFFLKVPQAVPLPKLSRRLRPRVLRVLPPDPEDRYPYVSVSVTVTSPMPEDLTQLDRAVGALRARAQRMLDAFGQALKKSRAEVVGLAGPFPIEEDFRRRLTARWGLKIFFQQGTDELTMRYLCSGLNVSVDEVHAGEYYLAKVLVAGHTTVRSMRAILKNLGLDPRPTLWHPGH